MRNIILILGDLASGKSTLADSLSAKLNYICLKKDTFKENISDVIGFNNREENKKISIASINLMINVLEEILKANNDAILEANFRYNEINAISSLAEKYNAKLEIVYLYGDYNLIYKRFIDRIPHRNKCHLSLNLDKDFNAFINYINDIRNDVNNVKAYKIDMTNLGKEEVLNKVINHLNEINF